ncbi:hypothetical protein BD779DRAFT_1669166 [Infundibulicybe gibba]|nr:hypothetical protein BD779DRAFT_1669166 [Infundibulicybe gibba]
MPSPTYDLFFTGRDDPRCCVIIGEDTKPVYFSFETPERGVSSHTRTMEQQGGLRGVRVGPGEPPRQRRHRCPPAPHVPPRRPLSPPSTSSARAFVSAEGRTLEWRRCRDNPTSYDLYAAPNTRIAVFRRFTQQTVVGPSHGLLQYTFTNDLLLTEAILALCLNRWIDVHGM